MTSRPSVEKALQHFQFFDNELRLNRESIASSSRRITPVSREGAGVVRFASLGPVRERTPGYTPASATRASASRSPTAERSDLANVKCFKCGQFGHISTSCLDGAAPDIRRSASRTFAQIDEAEALDEEVVSEEETSENYML